MVDRIMSVLIENGLEYEKGKLIDEVDSYQYMSALVGLEEEFCIEFPERYLGENIFDNVDRLGDIITECLSS